MGYSGLRLLDMEVGGQEEAKHGRMSLEWHFMPIATTFVHFESTKVF